MRMPREKKESTPRRKSGTAIHQLLSSRSPKNGRNATAMNRAAWITATTTVTENRDIKMVCGFTGANRRRRSRPFCRQLTRVSAEAKTADMAIPKERMPGAMYWIGSRRSEEHTSELQSRFDLVCRLLLEKKNI